MTLKRAASPFDHGLEHATAATPTCCCCCCLTTLIGIPIINGTVGAKIAQRPGRNRYGSACAIAALAPLAAALATALWTPLLLQFAPLLPDSLNLAIPATLAFISLPFFVLFCLHRSVLRSAEVKNAWWAVIWSVAIVLITGAMLVGDVAFALFAIDRSGWLYLAGVVVILSVLTIISRRITRSPAPQAPTD